MRTKNERRIAKFYYKGAFNFKVIAIILKWHAKGKIVTVRGLMRELNQKNTNGIWEQLERLKIKGLVDWEEGKHGTIRATCRFIPEKEL